MSLNIFENTNLDFDVSIIKTTRVLNSDKNLVEVVESVTPLETAAVLNLELRESSLSMGIVGSITVSNKFKVLDRLDITTNSPNDIYVAIKITDVELSNIDIGEENKCVTVVGYINNIASASQNAIDGAVVFSFEEAFVAALRQTQAIVFTGKALRNGRPVYNTSQDSTDYSVVTLLNSFNERLFKLKDVEPIVTEDSATPNTLVDIKLAIDEEKEIVSSVYDTVQEMLQITGVDVGDPNYGKTPYLRFVNSVSDDPNNSNIIRRAKFDAFFTSRHKQFVEAVRDKQKTDNTDFSDVYLEKFILGPLTDNLPKDPNTSLYNKIETYDITRANVGDLRESIWGDYRFDKQLPGQNKSIHSPITTYFFDIVKKYIQIDFENLEVDYNLPVLDPATLKEFHIPFRSYASDKEVNRALVQQLNKVINRVNKSFFTISETITFTVKGSVIRQPNKFIWLEDGKEEIDYKKLWYVNSVEHKFGSGRYTNTIIATKLFGNVTYGALLANELQTSRPSDDASLNIPGILA